MALRISSIKKNWNLSIYFCVLKEISNSLLGNLYKLKFIFSVPYHRPKQFSLKEFMSRRTISKPTGFPALQKTAAAIKMSDTDLALYA